ncbi:MAG: hypothetical protein K2H96_02025 [Muribaculaceae bacterium]|nr:hypothetical protein [Muribaculaceae bacterium]
MADNYLERKMEDLRRGTPVSSRRTSSGPQKGYVRFPFPARKVMIAGLNGILALPVIREFSKPGCKVAFIHSDAGIGSRFAREEGVRFHHLSNDDSISLEKAFDETIKAWREVDIIVCPPSIAHVLSKKWERHLQITPIPGTYRRRMIILSEYNEKDSLCTILNDIPWQDITVNGIQIRADVNHSEESVAEIGTLPKAVAQLAVFLSLPGNECIHGNIINIG